MVGVAEIDAEAKDQYVPGEPNNRLDPV